MHVPRPLAHVGRPAPPPGSLTDSRRWAFAPARSTCSTSIDRAQAFTAITGSDC
jgi:hypothetical protein